MKDFQGIHFGDFLHTKGKGGAVTIKGLRFLSLKPKDTEVQIYWGTKNTNFYTWDLSLSWMPAHFRFPEG